MTRRRVLAGLLAAVASSCLAPWLAARMHRAVTLSTDAVSLRPGDAITLSWEALPPETEEFELLLESAKPAALRVRLTESMDPTLGSFVWNVPNFPMEAGRICLRMGDGERETLWACSRRFRIADEPDAPTPTLASREGELWMREAPPSVPRPEWTFGAPGLEGAPSGRRVEAGATLPVRERPCRQVSRVRKHETARSAGRTASLSIGPAHRTPAPPMRI